MHKLIHRSSTDTNGSAWEAPGWLVCTLRDALEIRATISPLLVAMSRWKYTASDGLAVQVATSEALENAIVHGNHSDPGRRVLLRGRVEPEDVFVEVTDEGSGFDVEHALAHPDKARGIRLMLTYMTRVEFVDSGRRVRLQRHRGRGATTSSPPDGYDFQI